MHQAAGLFSAHPLQAAGELSRDPKLPPRGSQSHQRTSRSPARDSGGTPDRLLGAAQGFSEFPCSQELLNFPMHNGCSAFPLLSCEFWELCGGRMCANLQLGWERRAAAACSRVAACCRQAGSCCLLSRGRHYKVKRSLVRPFLLRALNEGANRAAWRNPSLLQLCSSS